MTVALVSLWPGYPAFQISFVTILVVLSHRHWIFAAIRRANLTRVTGTPCSCFLSPCSVPGWIAGETSAPFRSEDRRESINRRFYTGLSCLKQFTAPCLKIRKAARHGRYNIGAPEQSVHHEPRPTWSGPLFFRHRNLLRDREYEHCNVPPFYPVLFVSRLAGRHYRHFLKSLRPMQVACAGYSLSRISTGGMGRRSSSARPSPERSICIQVMDL